MVTVFASPLHPYTRALLGTVPRVEAAGRDPARRLSSIPGQVPSPVALPPGCSYAPRCPLADDMCRNALPPIAEVHPGHDVPGAIIGPPAYELGRSEAHGCDRDLPLPGRNAERGRIALRAVDRLNLSIAQGEVVGLVGESGSGKSTAGRAILRLLEPSAG